MTTLFRGEIIEESQDIEALLDRLPAQILEDLALPPLCRDWVINAVDELAKQFIGIDAPLVKDVLKKLTRAHLERKCDIELPTLAAPGVHYVPLGVLLHIGAGNAFGVSASSVVEGLLTGNINLLKCPENDGGTSVAILSALIAIEPRLKPYIYVFEVSSTHLLLLKKLVDASSAVVVWGSDLAIDAVRRFVPANMPIIEWGNRIGFAYFTPLGDTPDALSGLAYEICSNEQLHCTSPQCVFYETESHQDLEDFAKRLSAALYQQSEQLPPPERPFEVMARLTYEHINMDMEAILEEKRIYSEDRTAYAVFVDPVAKLKPSPLHRHIWVMPVKRSALLKILWPHKGHLQTAGLSCGIIERTEIVSILFRAGVTRVTSPGTMSVHTIGEPHDGDYAMRRYMKIVYEEAL